jgi:hypothetical protein
MGSLVPFIGKDDGLPPARLAYARNRAEARGLEAERAKQKAMRGRLEAELVKYENAGAEVHNLLNAGAQTLLDRLRAGFDPVLSTLGGRAADLDARRAASAHSAEIVRRAIAAIDVEIERLEGMLADLEAAKGDLIRAVIHESAEGLRLDHAETIERLREGLTRLAALERVLSDRHDWAPAARVVVEIPSLVWADAPPTEIVLAPRHEIQKAAEVFGLLALALESDPMAPLGEFSPVSANEDPDVPFHELSATERALVTRNTFHSNHQRGTGESRSFAAQALDAARSAIGL